MPSVNEHAPLFTLPDQDDCPVALTDFAGKWVVLYFYPKDDTSGCTMEAIDFSQTKDAFAEQNAVILGISPDSVNRHQKFICKHNLTIRLLSDPDHQVLEQYGVWQTKKMYGKEYMGVVRSTFLVRPNGTIAHIWLKVTVNGHADDVLNKLRELSR